MSEHDPERPADRPDPDEGEQQGPRDEDVSETPSESSNPEPSSAELYENEQLEPDS